MFKTEILGQLRKDPNTVSDRRQTEPRDHDVRGTHRPGEEGCGGKREGAEAEGGVMRVTQPAACFQSRRTECPGVVHFPTRYVGYYCEKCCPACRQKPAAKGE